MPCLYIKVLNNVKMNKEQFSDIVSQFGQITFLYQLPKKYKTECFLLRYVNAEQTQRAIKLLRNLPEPNLSVDYHTSKKQTNLSNGKENCSTQIKDSYQVIPEAKVLSKFVPSKRYFLQTIGIHRLDDCGKNKMLIVVDNSLLHLGTFSCIKYEDKTFFESYQNKINDYCVASASEPHQPLENEIILGKCSPLYGGKWNRCSVQVSSTNGYWAVLIDVGIIDEINRENVRKLPDKFAYPYLSANCYLKGITSYGSTVLDILQQKLRQLLPISKAIKCDEIKMSSTNYYYDCEIPKMHHECIEYLFIQLIAVYTNTKKN